MQDPAELKNVSYVIGREGRRAAVHISIEDWGELLDYVEALTDRAVVKHAIARLREGPEKAEALPWDEACSQWQESPASGGRRTGCGLNGCSASGGAHPTIMTTSRRSQRAWGVDVLSVAWSPQRASPPTRHVLPAEPISLSRCQPLGPLSPVPNPQSPAPSP